MQFPVDQDCDDTYVRVHEFRCEMPASRMNSFINFVELDNRVVSATYRNLMVRAKVVLVDKAKGAPLAEPVTTITSTLPNGSLRIRLPDAITSGVYFLLARNAHGQDLARSVEFSIG
jgi:hypothetical protein